MSVERREDLILVSGCTLVSSWAAATFVSHTGNMEAEISLTSRAFNNGGASFAWSKNKGPVEYRNSDPDQVSSQATFTLHALIVFLVV